MSLAIDFLLIPCWLANSGCVAFVPCILQTEVIFFSIALELSFNVSLMKRGSKLILVTLHCLPWQNDVNCE